MKLLKSILAALLPKSSKKKPAPSRTRSTKSSEKADVPEEGIFGYAASLLDKGPSGYRVEPEGSYDLEIVGESFYQGILESIAGPKSESGTSLECRAVLSCERDNPKDKNAVSVSIDRKVVGILSKSHAREWRKMLKSEGAGLADVEVTAQIVGGWKRSRKGVSEEGHFGVRLDVPVDG